MLVRLVFTHMIIELIVERNLVLLLRVLQHRVVNVTRSFRIVNRPVVVLQGHVQFPRQRVQPEPIHFRVQEPGQRQRINPRFGNRTKVVAGVPRVHKVHVKRSIMTDNHAARTEVLKHPKNLALRLGAAYHVIGNACQVNRCLRQRMTRIDKFFKPVNHRATLHLNGRQFNHLIVLG